jgi:folylpolyglutamate synthase/dihydropteroate synthase
VVPGSGWILDIAHNEPAARLSPHNSPRVRSRRRRRGVLHHGVLRDKDAAGIATALAEVIDRLDLSVRFRASVAAALRSWPRAWARAAEHGTAASVVAGCERARAGAAGDRVVVCGSLPVGPALSGFGYTNDGPQAARSRLSARRRKWLVLRASAPIVVPW